MFFPSSSSPAFSSRYSESIEQETRTPILSQSDHNDDQQQPNKVIEASGHFANNQIENGTVTCKKDEDILLVLMSCLVL